MQHVEGSVFSFHLFIPEFIVAKYPIVFAAQKFVFDTLCLLYCEFSTWKICHCLVAILTIWWFGCTKNDYIFQNVYFLCFMVYRKSQWDEGKRIMIELPCSFKIQELFIYVHILNFPCIKSRQFQMQTEHKLKKLSTVSAECNLSVEWFVIS